MAAHVVKPNPADPRLTERVAGIDEHGQPVEASVVGAAQVMASHLQNKMVPIEKYRPDLPVWLINWVKWLLQRDAANRPADAKAADQRVGALAKQRNELDKQIEAQLARYRTQTKGYVSFQPKLVLDPAKLFVDNLELKGFRRPVPAYNVVNLK